MQFSVEKYISNFVQNQFPQFYQEEGPNFILFLQAYYAWMEENKEYLSSDGTITYEGNPVAEARNLFDYRDIDNTLTKFLSHFQEKYLYGIPFNVIINQRFLLKHILDVYRSKGSIQSYRLLFKLIYDQDIEVYLPGTDLLKPSDGTWVNPKYLEVTNNGNLGKFLNQTIIGVTSGCTVILGSLDYVNILNGGQNFKIGDTLKIVHRNPANNQIISFGDGGYLKVTGLTTSSNGQLSINILNGGFGFTANPNVFLYRGIGDTTGTGASLSVGSISYTETVSYNTDVIADYLSTSISASSYNLPLYPAANLSSTINTALSYTSNTFGSVSSLTNVKTGSGYSNQAYVFVRSTLLSKTQLGTLAYSTTSNTITGTSTTFTTLFSNNDVIFIQANSFSNTGEYQVINQVVNNTVITLYGPPSHNASSGTYNLAPSIFPSNFALYETIMVRADNTIDGLNANIQASYISGGNIFSTAVALDSGKGYVDNETIIAYLYGFVNNVIITSGGSNYKVNDSVIFASTETSSPALGYVSSINGNGSITGVTLTNTGSGYLSIPNVRIQSNTGSFALLTCTINQYKTTTQVEAQIVKNGVGRQRGYWSTTKGFLNADKYIQDSYFYQDFSYQIKVATTLDKFKNILYNTFHPAGSELFGEFLSITNIPYDIESLLYNSTGPEISVIEDELLDILVLEDGSTELIQENTF